MTNVGNPDTRTSRTAKQYHSSAPVRFLIALWLPLAVSQFVAHAELPIVNSGVARGNLPELSLAALSITTSLAILAESWIMMVLPTSTALSRSDQSFRMVRRFTFSCAALLTAFMVALSVTPLFTLVVVEMMAVPSPVAALAKPALQILILWPAAIAIRRLYQGILIRLNLTGRIAGATCLRICVSAGVTYLGVYTTSVPAATIGAIGLISGVILESAAVAFIATRAMSRSAAWRDPEDVSLVSRVLLLFYAPLAVTSFLSYLTIPVLSSGISRMSAPVESLAIWSVVFGLIHALDALGYPLQETTIAARRAETSAVFIRGFSLSVGLMVMSIAAAIAFGPVGHWYFEVFAGLAVGLTPIAITTLRLLVMVPLLVSVQSWLRGRLVFMKKTVTVEVGMMVNLAFLSACLACGAIAGRSMGAYVAALSYGIGFLAEVLFLGTRIHRVAR